MSSTVVSPNYSSGFLNRRLHSLLGVIPVGIFLLEHLYTNYLATQGSSAFVKQVHFLHSLPGLRVLEILLIFLPLLYHAGYGLYIVFSAKYNVQRYGTFRNILFSLQRITGGITLIFILWHLWTTWLKVLLYDLKPEDISAMMATTMQNPLYFTLYAIGVVAAVFHFSNGMWSFLVSWGVTVGEKSQRVSTFLWLGVFVVLTYVGLAAMFAFSNPNFLLR